MPYFELRKQYLLKAKRDELKVLHNKARFVKLIVEGEIVLANVPLSIVYDVLEEHKFDQLISAAQKKRANKNDDEKEDGAVKNEETSGVDSREQGYRYLTSMPLVRVTREQYERLLKQRETIEAEVNNIESQQPAEIWIQNLLELKNQLELDSQEWAANFKSEPAGPHKSKEKKKRKPKTDEGKEAKETKETRQPHKKKRKAAQSDLEDVPTKKIKREV